MRQRIALVLVVATLFALRLPSLGLLPLYSDEAIGMWRAERVLEGSITRGAGEGKPLHAWMIAAALWLPGDPIRAARAAHVAAGALLVVALWDVARRRLCQRAAWTAAALWIVLPFPTVFERTVTPDVPLAAAGVAVVACALRVASPAPSGSKGWLIALYSAGAVATFVKMPLGLVLAATPVLVPFTLPAAARAAARAKLRPYVASLGAVVLVLAAIVATRAALGLRPLGFGVHELSSKVAMVRDPGSAPEALAENLGRVGEHAWFYLGPSGTPLLVLGVLAAFLKRDPLLRFLTGLAMLWTALFAGGARDLSAHYLLPVLPFFVLAIAYGLEVIASALTRRPVVASFATGAVVLLIAASSWPLLQALWNDPARAALARTERQHYVEGDWSGYGFPEAARWIERELALAGADPLVVALHVADYERLRLYASEGARPALVQAQIDRYTVRVPVMIDRATEWVASGRRVLVVVGSGKRFGRRWREAFPSAARLAVFPRPAGDAAVEVWELGGSPAAGAASGERDRAAGV